MRSSPWLTEEARGLLTEAGLDILVPFEAQRYNQAIDAHPRLQAIETFGHQATAALLIGSSRKLWPALKRALVIDPTLGDHDPVDRLVECSVRAFIEGLPMKTARYFGHRLDERMVSMLHAAEASGYAHRGPAHLAVHPRYGTWFALRALVSIDTPWTGANPKAPTPCQGCDEPCVSALKRAMSATPKAPRVGEPQAAWPAWLAIRDACPVGRQARYSDAQIRYHYAGDREGLSATEPPTRCEEA